MDMKERLQELAEAAGKRISESEGLEKLNEVRVAYLGKKGELTAILKSMKDVAPEERPKNAGEAEEVPPVGHGGGAAKHPQTWPICG